MSVEIFDSVFDALADTPAEAANMSARADLALAIRERVKAWQAMGGLTQEEAAARLGVTRPPPQRAAQCFPRAATASSRIRARSRPTPAIRRRM